MLARDGAPTAIVIGAGFGGLAAAVRLACKGWRVQVLEKLDAPGGRAYVHREAGYTFDAGPTIVTVPHLFEELWALAGRKLADDVTLKPLDPFYRIRFDDGTHFDYNGDAEHMRREVARFSPADLPGYERFMAEAERCYRIGFEELGATAFDSLRDLVSAIPALVRMRSWRSIRGMVNSHFRDPKLRIVFSFHPLLIGGNPSAVTCTYSLINMLERRFGVHWAMGGTGALVTGLVKLLAQLGVSVRCNTQVQRIVTTERPRQRRRVGGRRAHRRRHRRQQCRHGVDLPQPRRARAAQSLERPQAGPRALLDEPVRLVLRHRPPVRRRAAPHDGARPALRRAAQGHLQAPPPGGRLQPLPAPADGERPVDGAAGLRCVLCAVARAAPGQRHRLAHAGRARTARRSSAAWRARCCRAWASTSPCRA